MKAGVWSRAGRLYIESWVWPPPHKADRFLSRGWFYAELDEDTDVHELGRSVLAALEANYVDEAFDDPTEISEVIRAAGLTSYRSFYRGARYVSISEDDGRLRLTPSDGSRGRAFFFLRSFDAPSLEPDDIGTAVLQALEQCIPHH